MSTMESDSETVVVKRGPNPLVYHRRESDGTPACKLSDCDKPDEWKDWDKDQAIVWKEPCQNPNCYGDSPGGGVKSGDSYPV